MLRLFDPEYLVRLLRFVRNKPLTVSLSIYLSVLNVPFDMALSRRSVLQATRITGIDLPHIDRTSSIHCHLSVEKKCRLTFCVTLSKESGVSTEKAIRMICAFE